MPNIARNCIINVGETVVYDTAKDGLISSGHFRDGTPCHFTAAVIAGFCATLLASPVDVIKTRYNLIIFGCVSSIYVILFSRLV